MNQPLHELIMDVDDAAREEGLAEHGYLAACSEHGVFKPKEHGLVAACFTTTRRIYDFYSSYADRNGGVPPSLEAVSSRFPDFEPHPVSITWAAEVLRRNLDVRRILATARRSTELAREGDVEGAVTEMRSVQHTRNITGRMAGTEIGSIAKGTVGELLPPLYPAIERTGGIGVADYVAILARTNVGKSWRLMQHACACAMAGKKVVFYALEMTKEKVAQRAFGALIPNWRDNEFETNTRIVQEMVSGAGGRLTIADPSDGILTPSRMAEGVPTGGVAIIDYLGLMRSDSGRMMSEDWQTATNISHEVRALSLEHRFAVFAGVQANRSTGRDKPPDDTNIALADAIGQDIDVGIALHRREKDMPFMENRLFKVRDGEMKVRRWFTEFRPEEGKFGEIGMERAMELLARYEEGRTT